MELALRAWAPVFASMERAMGRELFVRLRGVDWRPVQEWAVRVTLAAPGMHVWVAPAARRIAGFVAATVVDPRERVGEVQMLAVDPREQGRGIGGALTDVATEWLRSAGMRVAMIDTGGDPGHAPARRVYERAAYTPVPIVRYFKAL